MHHLSQTTYYQRRMVGGLFTVAILALLSWSGYLGLSAQDGAAASATNSALAVAPFDGPTTSSPIALSQDKSTVWVVNPDDGSATVLGDLDNPNLAQRYSILTIVKNVGEEPQAIALDTGAGVAQRAYVVSPPDNGVTILKVNSLNPFTVVKEKFLTTGAEPWNVVASPDGARIFVANSAQDTITVIRTDTREIVGNIDLRTSACNVDDPERHFQPRGLAVTQNNDRLYVARFLSFTKPGGIQATDKGKVGIVCQIDLPAVITSLPAAGAFHAIPLAELDTGFKIPNNTAATFAYPNQMQSIVLRDNQAYLPNIASSTSGPLRFNVDTQAFVNVIDNAKTGAPADAPTKTINMHLGARDPEVINGTPKKKLFFANPWAIAFTNQTGDGVAYAVSSGSDLLVKLNVDATGDLTFTTDISTTRYIDLNDPKDPATSGDKAGKNPLGIVIRNDKAFVMNYISRNVSVVDLSTDKVEKVIRLTALPPAGSFDEQLQVGAEIFFSSRGHFEAPAGQTATVSLDDRLSSEGWQNCASCHFAGLTDGNVWSFVTGPRKSVTLNGTWSPHNPDDQRMLNYSAIFDEVQDFEINIRNVSGPGALAAPLNGSVQDPNHGLIISDTGNINFAPAAVPPLLPIANGGRPQVLVRLPGSTTAWPALDAMKEWVRFAIRTPEGGLTTAELAADPDGAGPNQGNPDPTGSLNTNDVKAGRKLFFKAACQTCHGGTKWSVSTRDFTPPPPAADVSVEIPPTTTVNAQFMNRFLFDISSFALGTAANPIGTNVGALEKTAGNQDALGKDFNGDGKGNGFNTPSLLGIFAVPPYYHNGACETLACVVSNQKHRTGNGKFTDVLANPTDQAKLVAWLETLDADTPFPIDLSVRSHDIFFDPPVLSKGIKATIGANIQLFGTKADLTDILADLGLTDVKVTIEAAPGLAPVTLSLTPNSFKQDFGQAVITTTWDIPADTTLNRATIKVTVDPANQLLEAKENNNTATRNRRLRAAPPDAIAPKINGVFISDDNPFDNADQIATSTNVKVKILATDEGGSGLDSYCIVRYRYKQSERLWEPRDCNNFTPLPAPTATDEFIVDAQLIDLAGVTYAFVWVKDKAGNISGTPGFDVINLANGNPIEMNRNDVRIFRFVLPAGTPLTLKFKPSAGDIDISVFDHFRNLSQSPTRCAVSAQNGTVDEQIVLPGTCAVDSEDNRLWIQVEVHAIANSRFTIEVSQAAELVTASALTTAEQASDLPTTPTVSGPPLRSGVDEAQDNATGDSGAIYLPLIRK